MITSFFSVKKRKVAEGPTDKKDEEADKKRTKASTQHVEDLLSPLLVADEKESSCAATSWRKALKRHFQSSSFEQLAKFVAKERLQHTIYPKPADTFAALTLTPLDQVKVVIVGQDPYHGPGQAHGLCFSVLPGQPIPPSLKNIYNELRDDPLVDFAMPSHGHLSRWARQGVLLLNTVLTVRRGEANSHKKRGWEVVTDEILRAVARRGNVVVLLWGKPAATKAEGCFLGSKQNNCTVIKTSHPSPLGARKTDKPFLGSKCFSRCNEALKVKGLEPIDWNVDGPI